MDRDAYQVHRWLQRFDLRAETFKPEE
jgi:hypothetical protein